MAQEYQKEYLNGVFSQLVLDMESDESHLESMQYFAFPDNSFMKYFEYIAVSNKRTEFFGAYQNLFRKSILDIFESAQYNHHSVIKIKDSAYIINSDKMNPECVIYNCPAILLQTFEQSSIIFSRLESFGNFRDCIRLSDCIAITLVQDYLYNLPFKTLHDCGQIWSSKPFVNGVLCRAIISKKHNYLSIEGVIFASDLEKFRYRKIVSYRHLL